MSTNSTATGSDSSTFVGDSSSLVWGGALVALFGVLALIAPFLTGIAISIVVGALIVVAGVVAFAGAFSVEGWLGTIWKIVLAVVYVGAGILILSNPTLGLTTLTLLVIAYFAVAGLVKVVFGVTNRSEPQWGWIVASGGVSLLLAALLWLGFPSTALWAVGVLVGVDLLATGLSLVATGMMSRRATTVGGQTGGAGTGGA
jgi:uncharacterized membrane protein HdeD (DUF308 family)